MQLANASAREELPAAAFVLGLCEEPQAARATAQPTARLPQTMRLRITRQV